MSRARWIEIDDEPMDSLVLWEPEKPKMLKREDMPKVFERYRAYIRKRTDAGIDMDCKHQYGMGHFWYNPEMEPPCRYTRVDGQWYLRKSCSHIPPIDEWDEWFDSSK